ncbi:hypothetical protein [Sphingobium sp. TomTYG75]
MAIMEWRQMKQLTNVNGWASIPSIRAGSPPTLCLNFGRSVRWRSDGPTIFLAVVGQFLGTIVRPVAKAVNA